MPTRQPTTQAAPKKQPSKPPRFQIVKLEERITPGLGRNHNQTFLSR
jgi:hypothetical protein